MAELGDWVTPWHGEGQPFWGKPPLSFWLTATSFRLFGINGFAARLPHFLCMLGVVALVLMTPLALTSFNAAIRAMGGRNWQRLHKLVYLVAMLGLLHFYWKKAAKNDTDEVMVYAVILAVLFFLPGGLFGARGSDRV